MRDGQRDDCTVCNLAAKRVRTALDPRANRDRVQRWQHVRELLCFRCNSALGDLRENIDVAQNAADYLDRDDELAAVARARVERCESETPG